MEILHSFTLVVIYSTQEKITPDFNANSACFTLSFVLMYFTQEKIIIPMCSHERTVKQMITNTILKIVIVHDIYFVLN